jgi:hypothetical protein
MAPRATSGAAPDLFKLSEVPGKGLGLVATAPIAMGTRILSEAPLIRQSRFAKESVSFSQFETLTEEEKSQIYELFNMQGKHHDLMGIIWTNAIELSGTEDEAGLFVQASRINHACVPNCHHSWDKKSGVLNVHAVRNIQVGEEITNSYIKGIGTFAERQSHCRTNFGFKCQCSQCSLPPMDRKKSDERIEEVYKLQAQLRILDRDLAPPDGVHLVFQLLQLLEKESYQGWYRAKAFHDATRIASIMHDHVREAIFASCCARIFATIEGETSQKAQGMRTVATQAWKRVDNHLAPAQWLSEFGTEDLVKWLFQLDI